jgi:hypothetical protein
MVKNRFVAFLIFVALFFIIWNILDLIFNAFITRSGYRFTTIGDVYLPLVLGLILGCLFFLRKKKS